MQQVIDNDTELDLFLRARLWVARLGDGDVLKWWRTDSVLGQDGAFVGPRVLPKTHPSGRARIAFAAARHACQQRYQDPTAIHLFRLDAWTEDAMDAYMHQRVGDHDYWAELMETLGSVGSDVDPASALLERGGVRTNSLELIRDAALGPGGKSLRLPQAESKLETIELMIAGFARGRAGQLVVPYIPEKEWRHDG